LHFFCRDEQHGWSPSRPSHPSSDVSPGYDQASPSISPSKVTVSVGMSARTKGQKSACTLTKLWREKSPDLLYSKQWLVSGIAQYAIPQRDCSVYSLRSPSERLELALRTPRNIIATPGDLMERWRPPLLRLLVWGSVKGSGIAVED
jgi:hypothetical protein